MDTHEKALGVEILKGTQMKDSTQEANFCGNLSCEMRDDNFEPIIGRVIRVKYQK